MNKNIVLVGFMGTGKTTIGRRVASRLGLDFFDTDEYIKKCEGMSAADVITKKGVKYFEGAQRFAVMNICENQNALIATGGATLTDERNREILSKNGILVWLKAKAETIYENTKNSHNKRLEIAGKTIDEIAEILTQHEKDYAGCDIVVDIDGSRNVDNVVEKVIEKIKVYISERMTKDE